MSKFIRNLRKNLINIPGWRTKRKIIIIESDDWGSVRMPSKKVYEFLVKKGAPVDNNYFNRFDSLESNNDLEELFEILSTFKDKNRNHPVITANTLVANPDFDKIKELNKSAYSYEPITKTYSSYPNHNRVMDLWLNKGIKENIFYPQYHGREHLNVKKYLRTINAGLEYENLSFDKRAVLGLASNPENRKYAYMAAFEYEKEEDKFDIEEMAADGLRLFEQIFGFKSVTFAPSQSIQGEHLNKVLFENGVKFHQLGQQLIPQPEGRNPRIKNHFWGDKNKDGQIYWRRNCTFEPSRNQEFDWVNSCMKEIQVAFRWRKPAVINSHRVNYIGDIESKNREQTLIKLKNLFKAIIAHWPNVEFMNSEDLGKEILKGKEK